MDRVRLRVTTIFLALALSLEALMTGHWFIVLEPRLRSEAVAQAGSAHIDELMRHR